MLKNIKKQNKNGGLALRRSEATGKGESSVFIKIHNAGFTLVEALVAISILMIAIASPMTLAQKGLSTANLSKDQMIASFLAQDAIEAVKNIRDQISISQTTGDWLDRGAVPLSLSSCICTSADTDCNFDLPGFKYCYIDTTAPTWDANSITLGAHPANRLKISYTTPLPGDIKQFLKYDYTGTNGSNGDEISKFTRYINIRKTSYSLQDPTYKRDEAVVSVRIIWNSQAGAQKMDLQNYIYNYSENLISF